MEPQAKRKSSAGAGSLKFLPAEIAPPAPQPKDKYLLINTDSKEYGEEFIQIKELLTDKLINYRDSRNKYPEQSPARQKAAMINDMLTAISAAKNARAVMNLMEISAENENLLLAKHRHPIHFPFSNPKSKSIVLECKEDARIEFEALIDGPHDSIGINPAGTV